MMIHHVRVASRVLVVVVLVAVLALVARDARDGSRGPTGQPSSRASSVGPSASVSGPCTGTGGAPSCGASPTRYTLARARAMLLTHAEIGKNDFPHYDTSRVPFARTLFVCEWGTERVGPWEHDERIAYRYWSDVQPDSSSSRKQQTFWQTAIVYPDNHKAQQDASRMRGPCAQPAKDTGRTPPGWTHLRGSQELRCVYSIGRCGKVVDILHKDNLIIVIGFAEVHTGSPLTDMSKTTGKADKILSALLAKIARNA